MAYAPMSRTGCVLVILLALFSRLDANGFYLPQLMQILSEQILHQYSLVVIGENIDGISDAIKAFRPPICVIGNNKNHTSWANPMRHSTCRPNKLNYPTVTIAAISESGRQDDVLMATQLQRASTYGIPEDRRSINVFVDFHNHKILQNFSKLAVTSHAEMFAQDRLNFFLEVSHGKTFTDTHMFEIYQIHRQKLVVDHVNLEENWVLQIKHRRSNMRKAFLKLVHQSYDKYKSWTQYDSEGKLEKEPRAGYVFISALAHALNFSYKLINGTGRIRTFSNGTITGTGKQLIDFEADVITNNNELIADRVRVFSFTQPVLKNKYEVFCRQFRMAEVKNIFFATFRRDVWILTGLFVPLVYLCYVFCVHLNHGKKPRLGIFSRGEATTTPIFTVLLGQGWSMSVDPSRWSSRFVLLTGLVLVSTLNAYFSSYIWSVFSTEPNLFHSLEDFQKYRFALVAQTRSLTAEEVLNEFATKWSNGDTVHYNVTDLDTAISKVLHTPTALLTSPNFYFSEETKFSERELCELRTGMRVRGVGDRSVVYFRKNDPLRTFWNYKLIAMRERGIVHHFQTTFNDLMALSCTQTVIKASALAIGDVQGAFVLFILGLLLSLIFLWTEKLYSNWAHGKNLSFACLKSVSKIYHPGNDEMSSAGKSKAVKFNDLRL